MFIHFPVRMKRNSIHFLSPLLPFTFLFCASFSQREIKRGKMRVMATKNERSSVSSLYGSNIDLYTYVHTVQGSSSQSKIYLSLNQVNALAYRSNINLYIDIPLYKIQISISLSNYTSNISTKNKYETVLVFEYLYQCKVISSITKDKNLTLINY